MNKVFQKDIFFNKDIIWGKKNYINNDEFKKIKSFFLKIRFGNSLSVHKRSGINVNSSNYKLSINKKTFLLKKWPNKHNINKIKSILEINENLTKNSPFFPKIIKIRDKTFFRVNNNFWTIYEFIDSKHFSGNTIEFKKLSFQIGKLFSILKKSKLMNKNYIQIKYYKKSNKKTLKKMKSIKRKWKYLFGKELTNILNKNFEFIEKTYLDNSKQKALKFKEQLSHIDLHPHNILVKKNKKVVFLDLDSCTKLNPGYALAFSCLKLCKQTIIKNKIYNSYKRNNLVKIFKTQVLKNYPELDKIFPHFYYFATSEVLRRIFIIFDQNLRGVKTWNKVLNIQINHLREAKILFG